MSSIVLIIQIILALLMLYHAVPKLIFSKEKLKSRGGKEIEYVDDLSQINLIVIGIIEFLTSLGLIIPELLNDFTWIIILFVKYYYCCHATCCSATFKKR